MACNEELAMLQDLMCRMADLEKNMSSMRPQQYVSDIRDAMVEYEQTMAVILYRLSLSNDIRFDRISPHYTTAVFLRIAAQNLADDIKPSAS